MIASVKRTIVTVALLMVSLASLSAQADFTEIGGAINYRRSSFDSNNYEELISYTASISYYYMEQSAIELSYTNGYSIISVKPEDPIDPLYVTQTNFQLLALDFVFSLAEKDDTFQPYVKIGGGYLKKDVFEQIDGGDTDLISHAEGLVPSGGIGFRIMVTKQFSVKFGLDAWTTPPTEQPVTVDYAGTAGVAWLF